MSDSDFVVVVDNGDDSDPVVHGPFDTRTAALMFEDLHVDAPKGARAFVVPMHRPERETGGVTHRAEPHDYVPGEGRHRMHTDPLCKVCGNAKH